MIKILNYAELTAEEVFARSEPTVNVADAVSEIIKDVIANGDEAVIRYAAKFDGIDPQGFRLELSEEERSAALEENDNEYAEKVLKRYNFALKDYEEASLNKFFNLGLFQNGDLNLVPLLKEVRKDIEAGDLKYVLIEAVPNTRNNDFVLKNVLPGTFTGTF